MSQENKATEYRREAKQIRAVARQITLNEAKDQLLEAAKRLETLAEEEDRKARHAASPSKPEPET